MRHLRFERLYRALCDELFVRLPRYRLWLALHELGVHPERIDPVGVMRFLDEGLDDFLRAHGVAVSPRRARRLRRRMARFDPSHPSPEERLTALTR